MDLVMKMLRRMMRRIVTTTSRVESGTVFLRVLDIWISIGFVSTSIRAMQKAISKSNFETFSSSETYVSY